MTRPNWPSSGGAATRVLHFVGGLVREELDLTAIDHEGAAIRR
jgi:hypothetical protein